MKRILAAIICAAFLAVPAVAGHGKSCDTLAAKSCCAQKQAAKKGCCDKAAKADCDKSAKKAKSSCCDKGDKAAMECTTCPSGWFMGRNKAECGKCQTAS